MICEQGDIINVNFNPSLSHEPAGRHYGVVISPWEVNRMCALTTIVPVTSTDNGYPFHVPIAEGNAVYGFVRCEGIRAVDLRARALSGRVERVGELDDATLSRVLATILVVLGMDDDARR